MDEDRDWAEMKVLHFDNNDLFPKEHKQMRICFCKILKATSLLCDYDKEIVEHT